MLAPAKAGSVLPTLYAGAIIVAGLYYGSELMVPLVMAALFAFVLAPGCALLQRVRLPRVLAVLAVVAVAFAVLGGIGLVVGRQAASLADGLPTYRSTITTKWTALVKSVGIIENFTRGIGAPGPDAAREAPGGKQTGGRPTEGKQTESKQTGDEAKLGKSDPHGAAKVGTDPMAALGLDDLSGLSLARRVAAPILSPLATGGIVLVFTLFMLLSYEDLRDRLVRLVGRKDLYRTILAMNDAARRLSRYFLFQLALNTAFGAFIGCGLWAIGLPNPVLWGILAAVLRFIPFIGIMVAAIPPLLLAIAIVPGWSVALLVLGLFVVAEGIMGQVIEPLIYGHNTGLSPIAVIVATAFWGLLWGPIGLLMATPLTVCLVVIGRHVEALAFLDVILGDSPPLEPPETFYQRALEGRGATLVPKARKWVADASLTDYFDKVALPGLALAQGDLARDGLAFERLEAIHGEIETVLAGLEVGMVGRPSADSRLPGPIDAVRSPDDWRRDGAIVCIPGRGQLDDLAATMAASALSRAGFGARTDSNLALGSRQTRLAEVATVRLCCLSVLEEGSTVAAIRYFIKRIQKQMPDVAIVVGLWHADGTSEILSELRAEGANEHVVLSIGELIAFCHALAARTPEAKPSEAAPAPPRQAAVGVEP